MDEEWLTDSEPEAIADEDTKSVASKKRKLNSKESAPDGQKPPKLKTKRRVSRSSPSPTPRSATGSDHTAPNPKPADEKDILLILFEELIEKLETHNKSFIDLLLFVFKPKRRSGTIKLRNRHFWDDKRGVRKLLAYWSHSHQSYPGRHVFLKWIRQYVGGELRAEARKVTASGVLRTSEDKLEPEYLHQSFKISHILEVIKSACPLTVQMMLDFVTPTGARRRFSEVSRVGQTTCTGLYMFAIGLQRQGYDILSHIGTVTSYNNLIRGKTDQNLPKPHTNKSEQPANLEPGTSAQATLCPSVGAVKMLTNGCRKLTKKRWKKRRHGIIFDNMNFVLKCAQQTLGRTDSQENGTCATIFELHNATPEALDHSAARSAFAQAGPLEEDHVLHDQAEQAMHRKLIAHAIVRIVLKYGGEDFKQYQPFLDDSQPIVAPVIEPHTSNIYPLPAMDIDESSINGVISVFEAIFKELEIDIDAKEFVQDIILVAGDLKSGLNLDGAQNTRIGQEEPKNSLSNLEYVLGLFHTKMAAVVSILSTHLGSPTAGQDAPGSLFFHNSILERKPFVATSLPPFAVAKDLIMDSLGARVIHCLLRLSNCSDLESYLTRLKSYDSTAPDNEPAYKNSWERLLSDAKELFDTYVNISTASKLQSDRRYAGPNEKLGDMVYEGAVYFLRDALNLEELFDAVKCGHSGRILSVLKLFAISFRGSGRPQYARALLRLIHHCEVVWPPKLRDLILQNWLANPTGRPKGFVELDLVQEHLIYWIKRELTYVKRVYSAHGSNETWEWLTMITPCIGALRTLTRDFNEMIGNYRTTHHSSPDKTRDILKIIESLEKYKVYEVHEGRTFDNKCDPIVDAQSLGLESLFWGKLSGLKEYNKEFKARQKAYQGPDIAHTVPHTAFPRYPGAAVATQSTLNGSTSQNTLGPDSMEVDWADNELEDAAESEDIGNEAEDTPNEEELFDAMLPLENEEDVSLEVDAADIWDMIYGSDVEDDFDLGGDEAA
ncbi:hypothetical protein FRC07_013844 [Ceratobasidium sp. 392]|nr:hypothetical protein FRC07_013844 [Ceratobasidium sp. 392]